MNTQEQGDPDWINIPAAEALRSEVMPGQKLIWRQSFRWMDDSGVLPNHYEGASAPKLADEFGYEIVKDVGFAAIIVDKDYVGDPPNRDLSAEIEVLKTALDKARNEYLDQCATTAEVREERDSHLRKWRKDQKLMNGFVQILIENNLMPDSTKLLEACERWEKREDDTDTQECPDVIGSGGDSPSYRASMKDAGRGRLLP